MPFAQSLAPRSFVCVAVLGVARIVGGEYLILATQAKKVANLRAGGVWRVSEVWTVTLRQSKAPPRAQDRILSVLRSMPQSVRGMLFSREADIINPLQVQRDAEAGVEAAQTFETWTRGDLDGGRPPLVWNAAMLKAAGSEVTRHPAFVEVIVGFAGARTRLRCRGGEIEADVELLAKSSAGRPGTRFHRRGVDGRGAAANFVESEMRVTVRRVVKGGSRSLSGASSASSSSSRGDDGGDGGEGGGAARGHGDSGAVVASLVLLRGSAPLLWTQTPFGRYTPLVTTGDAARSAECGALHLGRLVSAYGSPMVAVSLIGEHGTPSERVIAAGYADVVQAHAEEVAVTTAELAAEGAFFGDAAQPPPKSAEAAVRLVGFDYHQKCRGGRLNKGLAELRETLADSAEKIGWYEEAFGPGGEAGERVALRRQTGAFRVSCMDSLDRTNVAQTMVAMEMLRSLCGGAELDASSEAAFRSLWGDHGDRIAQHYAGTYAFKRDVTRHGRRTLGGKMADALTATRRYMRALFSDARKQDAMDIFSAYGGDSSPWDAARELSKSGRHWMGSPARSFMGSTPPSPGVLSPRGAPLQSFSSPKRTNSSPVRSMAARARLRSHSESRSFLNRIANLRPWRPAVAPEEAPMDAWHRTSHDGVAQRAKVIRRSILRASESLDSLDSSRHSSQSQQSVRTAPIRRSLLGDQPDSPLDAFSTMPVPGEKW